MERRNRDDDRGTRREEEAPRRRGGNEDRGDDRGARTSSRDEGRSRSRSSYQYQERSREDTQKRSQMGAGDYDRLVQDHVKAWKVSDGDNRIRILPPTWKDPKHYGYDIWVHYGVGPDRQGYLDLAKMKGEADPITEECNVAKREGEDEYAKQLESKRRVGVWLIDRKDEKAGPQFWAMPWTVDRDIVKVSIDKQTGEVLPVDNPDEGYDIDFEKKGSKDRTEYLGVTVARRSSPLGKDEWLDYAVENPIPDILQYYDYAHIAKAFGGGGSHKGRDDKTRDRDRDDSRGSSSRDDRDRGRDDRGARDDRDDRDDRSSRGSSREESRSSSSSKELSWADVHEMSSTELDALVDAEKLDLNPDKFDSDAELAAAICEELRIDKPREGPSRRESRGDPDADAGSKLREMRERR